MRLQDKMQTIVKAYSNHLNYLLDDCVKKLNTESCYPPLTGRSLYNFYPGKFKIHRFM